MEYFDRFQRLVTKKSYDEQNALSLAVACDLAYKSKSTITTVVRSWQLELVAIINKKKGLDIDTQCYLMSDAKNIITVFRGSDTRQDWLTNFQVTQNPGPLDNTSAHEGFQDALYPAVMALTKHITDAKKSKKKIWITGHSFGGALGSLYAGMLFENDIDVYGIYTFASPRPASPQFEQQLNTLVKGPHYRVVNTGDIVPHVPPEPFYSHPGKRIILKANRKDISKKSWFQQRVSALKHFVKITGQKFDIVDSHRLSADNKSYIPRLIKDLKRARS